MNGTAPRKATGFLASLRAVAATGAARAGIRTVFEDKPLFESLLGNVTAIDFVAPDGVPGFIPADTYASLGLVPSSQPTHPGGIYYRSNNPAEGWVDGQMRPSPRPAPLAWPGTGATAGGAVRPMRPDPVAPGEGGFT